MENTDLIYGLHAVTEALNGDLVNKLYVQEDLRGKNVEKIKELARIKKVNISWTPKTELNKLTENGVHQGFMARVSEFAYAEYHKYNGSASDQTPHKCSRNNSGTCGFL